MNAERRARITRLARIRGDKAAVAIIEGGRRFTPDIYPDFRVVRIAPA